MLLFLLDLVAVCSDYLQTDLVLFFFSLFFVSSMADTVFIGEVVFLNAAVAFNHFAKKKKI